MDAIAAAVTDLIERAPAGAPPLQAALELILAKARGQGGTIHLLDRDGATLRLAAWSRSIPEQVLAAVRAVPMGKGMAGIAAERRAPVTTCDLQSDNAGGAARPGAKATGFRGSICIPLIAADGRLLGTLGVGCAETREFSEEEVADLLASGRAIAGAVAREAAAQ